MSAEHRSTPETWGATGSIFLATKISAPRDNGRWVKRPRLLARLGAPPASRLTLVHAGPGFGKTALLTQWTREVARAGIPVAWLSVDAHDDVVHLFIAYLAAAINRVCPEVGGDTIELITRSGQQVSPDTLLAMLVNQTAELKTPLLTVIDDFHFLGSSLILDWMTEFAARAPDNLSIAVAARTIPPQRLARLRATGQIEEIGPADLALTIDEIQEYVNATTQLKLTPADIDTLSERSEGWAAGLQMITIALRGKRDVGHLINSFSGAARSVSGYLHEEVFETLPIELRDFLLRSSILGRLCADLGKAVTGVDNAAELIAEIEKRELFLIPLDDSGHWYRYHHLFADFLAAQLMRQHAGESPGLHARASQWFAARGLWREAVQHAIEAGDYRRAMEVANRCAMNLVRDGDYFVLQMLLAKLPEKMHRKGTSLQLAEAWMLALHGQGNAAEQALRGIGKGSGGAGSEAHGPELLAIRLTLAYVQDDSQRISQLLPDANELQVNSQPWVADVMKCAATVDHLWHRRYAAARDFSACTTVFKRVYQLVLFGWSSWYQGRVADAEASWQAAADLADSESGARSLAALLARIPLARLDYERGSFAGVERALAGRIGVLEQVCTTDLMASATYALAWSRAACGDPGDGIAMFDRMRLLAADRGWVRMEAMAILELLRLCTTARPDHAVHLAQRLQAIGPALSHKSFSTHWLGARLCSLGVAFHRAMVSVSDDSTRALAAIVDDIVELAQPLESITATLLLAQAFTEHGDRQRALDALGRALLLAQDLGIARTFVDSGEWAIRLVRELRSMAAIRPLALREDYLDHLLHLADGDRAAAPARPAAANGAALLEPLSTREREVLALVGRGLSNREIGRSLQIGPETVKWHLKNTFSKLGVSNRVQALNRAQVDGIARR